MRGRAANRTVRRALLLLVPLVLVVAACDPLPPPPPPPPPVELYGDSLSVEAYNVWLWNMGGQGIDHVDHVGVGTTLHMWVPVIDAGYRRKVILAFGTNDARTDDLDAVIAEWVAVLGSLPADACVVWPKTYESSAAVTAFNTALLTELPAFPNVRVLDWNAQLQAQWLRDDGIHYLTDGTNKYGEMLVQAAKLCS